MISCGGGICEIYAAGQWVHMVGVQPLDSTLCGDSNYSFTSLLDKGTFVTFMIFYLLSLLVSMINDFMGIYLFYGHKTRTNERMSMVLFLMARILLSVAISLLIGFSFQLLYYPFLGYWFGLMIIMHLFIFFGLFYPEVEGVVLGGGTNNKIFC